MNTARLALSKAIKQNNYAVIQIERGNYLEARQVLPATLYSLQRLLSWQNTDSSSDTFFHDATHESDGYSNSESVVENDISTMSHSKLGSSCDTSFGPIADNSHDIASRGDTSDQQIHVYRTPIHIDHDIGLQKTLVSKAEEIAVISSSAAVVIFNLALVLHLSVTKPDGKNNSCSSTDEAQRCRKLSCLVKAESLYMLCLELISHNMMSPDMDNLHGTLLLAVINNLGAVRLQRNEQEGALTSFQYLMNILMLMVDQGIVIRTDFDRFFANALLAENRFMIRSLIAPAA